MTEPPPEHPIWIRSAARGWLRFSHPIETLRAREPGEVAGVLARIEEATAEGLWAAGFLGFQAAPAFDPALVVRAGGSLPVAWFELFERAEPARLPAPAETGLELPAWQPSLDPERFAERLHSIRDRIERGDTYQVNFTWRMEASFEADPWAFFVALAHRHPARYAAFLDLGDHAVCSLSPELFFRLDAKRLTCRPMKGTAPRGLYPADDERRREQLRTSAKNRAENVMIVDMVRNDLGRIARAGSVEATSLFAVETLATVLQMTSTVEAETDRTLSEILAALFPSASITGAPKVETMKIIAELEDQPRGIYTGAIGYAGPNRQAQFNVAIRTLEIDRRAASAVYGTGGGIVWDSAPESEFAEGRAKTLVLAPAPAFCLLETMRWENGAYHLLERHLERLAASARYFGFRFEDDRLRAELHELSERLTNAAHPARRVRLLLERDGRIRLEHREIDEAKPTWDLALAAEPIDPEDRFYYHKTTERSAYERFRQSAPEADDVLLWNPAGELTETTLANVALRLAGCWYTPPVACGLLAGTERAELLARGRLIERVLTLEDLDRAEDLAIVNSVRGWVPARRLSLESPPERGLA